MTRDLRLEFPGALYHVTARGNERQPVFRDDPDRNRFLALLAREVNQLRWRVHAYCLMGNHYHMMVETPEPNLSSGMRRLNSAYSQYFNKRHDRVGHLFQGRYHAAFVEKEPYLLELCRYIVLNPVRANMVNKARDWPWSSYQATAGLSPAPAFLDVEWLLGQFHAHLDKARHAYRAFINADVVRCPWDDVHAGIWLGTEAFRNRLRVLFESRDLREVPRAQHERPRPDPQQVIDSVLQEFGISEEALWTRKNQEAFQTAVFLLRRAANLPLRQVAHVSGVSVARISTIQRRIEDGYRPLRLQRLLRGYQVRVSEPLAMREYEVKIRPRSPRTGFGAG